MLYIFNLSILIMACVGGILSAILISVSIAKRDTALDAISDDDSADLDVRKRMVDLYDIGAISLLIFSIYLIFVHIVETDPYIILKFNILGIIVYYASMYLLGRQVDKLRLK